MRIHVFDREEPAVAIYNEEVGILQIVTEDCVFDHHGVSDEDFEDVVESDDVDYLPLNDGWVNLDSDSIMVEALLELARTVRVQRIAMSQDEF